MAVAETWKWVNVCLLMVIMFFIEVMATVQIFENTRNGEEQKLQSLNNSTMAATVDSTSQNGALLNLKTEPGFTLISMRRSDFVCE